METGYIKLYRILIKKPIWLNSTPEHKAIMITLLLLANHEPAEWEWMGKKFKVQRGQFVTSLESIRKKTGKGISIQNVRSCLKRLEKLDFATNEATKAGRLITIVNWDSYQPKKEKATKIPTVEQQSSNKAATPNKNDKNNRTIEIKKDIPQNEDFEGPEKEFYLTKKKRKLSGKRLEAFNLFWTAFDYKFGKAAAADSWLDIPVLKNGLVNEIVEAAKAEASLRQDKINNGQTPKYAQGWISDRRWEDEYQSRQESAAEYAKRKGLE